MVIAGNAPDLMGAMIVIGVMAHIAIQVILNIAVVTNTIPNTGVTLPFISYGGTSVMFLMLEMGMVLLPRTRLSWSSRNIWRSYIFTSENVENENHFLSLAYNNT